MSDVLLVVPPQFDGKAVARDEGTCGVSGILTPTVQPLFMYELLERDGFEPDLIDMQVMDKNPDYSKYEWVIVWCSIYGSLYQDLEEVRKAKEAGCKTVVIVNRPIIEDEIMERFKFIDYFVRYHERERTIQALLKGDESKGLIYRKDGKLVVTPMWPYTDMKHLDFQLPWHLLPMEKYEKFFMIVSKGCGMMCDFCEFRGWKFIHRDVDVLLDELEYLSQYKKFIKIETNDMFMNKQFARDFMDGIIKRRIEVDYQACVRANNVNGEMLDLAARSGMEGRIQLGVESPSEKARNLINKCLPDKILWDAINAIKEHEMNLELLLMWGFPWDSHQTANEMISFIKRVKPDRVAVSSVRPIVGTPLHQLFRDEGLLTKDLVLDDYVKEYGYHWVSGTKHLSLDEVKNEHARILEGFNASHEKFDLRGWLRSTFFKWYFLERIISYSL
jgi:hypothetical protein